MGVLTFAFGLATLASAIAMTWVIVTRTFEPLARGGADRRQDRCR